MEKEFEPDYAFIASDSMELVTKIATYVSKKYLELFQSVFHTTDARD